ncbi:uncharacterized protein LOC112093191 [Morus notabilis]|uniref:uncharacterized protein LOC112093191 n=1 Tax=Morus notabilis TaxID=981085 RepID=UPI000CED0177|nr:uncharacterized protein LOC112093191 [Morus notabilis]
MGPNLRKVKKELTKFESYEILQVPRAKNTNDDALAKLASSKDLDMLGVIPIEELEQPSIDEKAEVLTTQAVKNWMTPLVQYLMDAKLPNDKDEARRVKYRAARFGAPHSIMSDNGKQLRYIRNRTAKLKPSTKS